MAHTGDAGDARKRTWWSWVQRCCCCKADTENKSSDISCIVLSTRQTGPIEDDGTKKKDQCVHQAVNAGYSEDSDEEGESNPTAIQNKYSHSSSTIPAERPSDDDGTKNKDESVHQAVNAGYSKDSDEEEDGNRTNTSSTFPDRSEARMNLYENAVPAKGRLSSDSAAKSDAVVKESAARKETEVDGAVQRSNSRRGQRTATQAVAVKRRRRKDLFTSTEVFHRVDTHAIRTGAELKKQCVCDVKRITQSITQGTRTELETLRAIWVWLCHYIEYDVSGFLGQSEMLCSPEEVIAAGRGVCCGYSSLCLQMCSEVGIGCQEVSGHSKGVGHQQGQSLRNAKSDHAWNAVLLGGQWFLIDACWGAGTIDMERKSFEKRFDDFYFLTEPEEFINSHFPIEERWQLLDPPMPLEEFEKSVKKTSAFYTMGLSRLQPKHYKVVTVDGEANVSMGSFRPMNFTYKISQHQNLQRHSKNSSSSLNSSGFLTFSDHSMNLQIRPPSSGTYDVEVFASPELAATTLSLVCSFTVECPTPRAREDIPNNPFSSWGLKPTARSLGVAGSGQVRELAEVEAGVFELVLNTSRSLTVVGELVHPQLEPAVAKRCLATQIQPHRLTCHVLCPLRGFYRLSLFVGDYNDAKNAGAKLQNGANYLLHCEGKVVGTDELFPPNLSSSCGPGTCAEKAGLSKFSHTGAFISTQQGKCDITFHNQQELKILAVLEQYENKTRMNSRLERHIFITYTDRKVAVSVSLPKPGVYRLGLYAKTTPEGNNFSHVCDFVVRNSSTRPGPPFPYVYSDWGKGCQLLEPRSGLLEPLSWVRFRVRVPGVRRVTVIAEDGGRTELKTSNNGVWEVDVSTGRVPQKLKLAASSEESGSMAIMMTFDVTRQEEEE